MTNYSNSAAEILRGIRTSKPIVHNITNFVVMNFTANVLLASGASPIMAHAPEEIDEIVAAAGSVVVNIGTLSGSWIDSMKLACRSAQERGKPVVLDPVGAGATRLRTETALTILREYSPAVVRGNPSEILALAGMEPATRGVDSVDPVEAAMEAATHVALGHDTVVAVTGARDFVTDGRLSLTVSGGSRLMCFVTGTGCAASALVGAFIAKESDALIAASGALAYLSLAAERAEKQSKAPGSFRTALIDQLYSITSEDLQFDSRIIRS